MDKKQRLCSGLIAGGAVLVALLCTLALFGISSLFVSAFGAILLEAFSNVKKLLLVLLVLQSLPLVAALVLNILLSLRRWVLAIISAGCLVLSLGFAALNLFVLRIPLTRLFRLFTSDPTILAYSSHLFSAFGLYLSLAVWLVALFAVLCQLLPVPARARGISFGVFSVLALLFTLAAVAGVSFVGMQLALNALILFSFVSFSVFAAVGIALLLAGVLLVILAAFKKKKD